MRPGRLVAVAALVAVAIPLAAYGANALGWRIPQPLLAAVTFLCPPYLLFAATAACKPLDSCSLEALAVVVGANAMIYSLVALTLRLTFARSKVLGVGLLIGAFALSAWWVNLWFGYF